MSPKPAVHVEYVDFVFRVFPDGRRQRFARHVVRDAEGTLRVGDTAPTGVEAQQVAALIDAGLDEPAGDGRTVRRVVVDERVARLRRMSR